MNNILYEVWNGDLYIGLCDEYDAEEYYERGYTVLPCYDLT